MVQYVSMVVLPLASDNFAGDDSALFHKRRLETILGAVARAS